MKLKNISVIECFRMTCYTFYEPSDVENFLRSKSGKIFNILDTKRDNVGFHLIIKQPIDKRYSRLQPTSTAEQRYFNMPSIGNTYYLKQNNHHRSNIRVNWTFNVWEYLATTEEAIERFKQRIQGKYIHLQSVTQIGSGWLIRVYKRNTFGYKHYPCFFSLTADELQAYLNTRCTTREI